MHDLGRGKAVEPSCGGVAVSADILGINQVLDFQVGQLFRKRDSIQSVTGLTEHRTNFGLALLKRAQVVLAMIENDPAESVIDAIINIVAAFAVPHGLANNSRHGGGGRSNQETARF